MRMAIECTLWRCSYTDIGIALDTYVCFRKPQMQAKQQSLLTLVRRRCQNLNSVLCDLSWSLLQLGSHLTINSLVIALLSRSVSMSCWPSFPASQCKWAKSHIPQTTRSHVRKRFKAVPPRSQFATRPHIKALQVQENSGVVPGSRGGPSVTIEYVIFDVYIVSWTPHLEISSSPCIENSHLLPCMHQFASLKDLFPSRFKIKVMVDRLNYHRRRGNSGIQCYVRGTPRPNHKDDAHGVEFGTRRGSTPHESTHSVSSTLRRWAGASFLSYPFNLPFCFILSQVRDYALHSLDIPRTPIRLMRYCENYLRARKRWD